MHYNTVECSVVLGHAIYVHSGVPITITAVLLLRKRRRLLATVTVDIAIVANMSSERPIIASFMGLKWVVSTFLVVRR